MTALSISDIPSNIDTLEKLAMWASLALSEINLTKTAVEAPGYTQRVSQAGIFYVDTESKHRALLRLSIPVDKAHLAGASNTWSYAEPLSEDPIPAAFKIAA